MYPASVLEEQLDAEVQTSPTFQPEPGVKESATLLLWIEASSFFALAELYWVDVKLNTDDGSIPEQVPVGMV